MKKRTIALLCSCAVLVGIAANSTMAWLTDETAPVINTFTVGDIEIDLREHEYLPDTYALGTKEVYGNSNYSFVPGDTLPKDPFVEVKPGSEACWLFVYVGEVNNTVTKDSVIRDVIQYDVFETTDTDSAGKTGYWTSMAAYMDDNDEGNTADEEYAAYKNYFYMQADAVPAGTEAKRWNILTDNQVYVDAYVTEEIAKTLEKSQPQLVFKAAAVQRDDIISDPIAAWNALPKDFKPQQP